jgi:uncharacterized protein (DUF2252 family)
MSTETQETEGAQESKGAVQAAPPPPKPIPHLTVAARTAAGKAARAESPRAGHSALDSASERDPVGMLEQQAPSRVQELLPLRYARMLVSPFTFYRGAANIMAKDLSATPHTGLTVQLCGDAHLSNFGGFASPERSFLFDLNDFDETLPGPFEWDVKRLAASFEVAGRDRGFTSAERRRAVLAVVRAYREAIRGFATQTNLDVWYARLDAAALQEELRSQGAGRQAKAMTAMETKARTKDSMKAFSRLTEISAGERRIVSDPPVVTPIRDLIASNTARDAQESEVHDLLRAYRRTLQGDRRRLLESFRYVDLAMKVVGVGSVGTRCWILLLLGRDDSDPLFLQVKEAGQSVLEPWLGKSKHANSGQRVVEGQRLMQASSDIFLGWIRNKQGLDGKQRDFYVRQLWDWKASIDLEVIRPRGLELYARSCGWMLARAHARSGDRVAIASYLGKADAFDRAIADFADVYADLNERDYKTVAEAARAGRITAKEGL